MPLGLRGHVSAGCRITCTSRRGLGLCMHAPHSRLFQSYFVGFLLNLDRSQAAPATLYLRPTMVWLRFSLPVLYLMAGTAATVKQRMPRQRTNDNTRERLGCGRHESPTNGAAVTLESRFSDVYANKLSPGVTLCVPAKLYSGAC